MNLTKQVSFTRCFWRYLGACISFDAQLEGRTQQNHCRSAIISRNDCRFVFKRQNENDYRSAIIVGASGPINRYQSAAEWMNWTKHISSTKCSWRDLDVCISSYTQLEGRTQKMIAGLQSFPDMIADLQSLKMHANPTKSNEILRGTPCKMDAYPLQSNEILKGTPCKMHASPVKFNGIPRVTPFKMHANPLES